MSLLGKTGLKQVALLSAEKAQTLAQRLCELEGFELWFDGPFVREIAIRTPLPASEIIRKLVAQNILPGIDAGRWYPGFENCLILATTEKRTDQEIDRLVGELGKLASNHVVSQM